MLQVQDAVRRSISTFAELVPNASAEDVRLEEVSLSPDESSWLVTLSFKNPDYEEDMTRSASAPSNLAALMSSYTQLHRRDRRTIKLRADTGDFVGMKAEWEN